MTLDLSKYATTADTPEVAALKKRVKEVTAKYTTRHGWCDEAKNALREMGIETQSETVAINVTANSGVSFTVHASVNDLLDKTEAQQKKKVIDLLGGQLILRSDVYPRTTVGYLKLTPDDITDMTLEASPTGEWRAGSANGRVLHYYTTTTMRGTSSWVRALCRTEALRSALTDKPGMRHCPDCDIRYADLVPEAL